MEIKSSYIFISNPYNSNQKESVGEDGNVHLFIGKSIQKMKIIIQIAS